MASFLLKEDGFYLLQENGGHILLENSSNTRNIQGGTLKKNDNYGNMNKLTITGSLKRGSQYGGTSKIDIGAGRISKRSITGTI